MFQDCGSEAGAVYRKQRFSQSQSVARVFIHASEAETYLFRYQMQSAAPCSSTWMLTFCEGGGIELYRRIDFGCATCRNQHRDSSQFIILNFLRSSGTCLLSPFSLARKTTPRLPDDSHTLTLTASALIDPSLDLSLFVEAFLIPPE